MTMRFVPYTAWVLVTMLVLPGGCHRKEPGKSGADGPGGKKLAAGADPAAKASAARNPPARPAMRRVTVPARPARPASANVPGPTLSPARKRAVVYRPAAERLTAFVGASEAVGDKAIDPKPLLNKYVGDFAKRTWAGSVPAAVTVKVLRIDLRPMAGAIVWLTPKGYQVCKGQPKPIVLTAVETVAKGGKASLWVQKLKTEIRVGHAPTVEITEHFKDTRAFFVNYEYNPDLESCKAAMPGYEPTSDSKAALFKAGRLRLVQYKTYTTERSWEVPGVTIEVNTKLTWYSANRPGRHLLGISEELSRKVYNTGAEDENMRYKCVRTVSVIAMERGKYWRGFAGKSLRSLRRQEPSLGTLPKAMRVTKREDCSF